MKKAKYYGGVLALIIAVLVYASESLLGIDLLGLLDPDTEKPIISVEALPSKVLKDDVFDTSSITCSDNIDESCNVVITGAIDTSIVGTQTFVVSATDTSGNKEEITVSVEVYEQTEDGLDTTMYVPTGYYDGVDGLNGEALKNLLNDIITGHTEFPYTHTTTDVWDMLRKADEDPNNPDNVLLFYTGISWPKECQDTTKSSLPDYCFENNDREASYTEWNREHIWSKSHGDFEQEDEYIFKLEKGGYALGAHTDGHHLVPAERKMNSTKNNRFFDDCHSVAKYDINGDGVVNEDDGVEDEGYGNYTCGEWYFEPRDEVKGDVARMLFYMVIRYEGEDGDYVDLELTSNFEDMAGIADHIKNDKLPYYADLDVLLQWHIDDPVDMWELERHQSIFEFQGNRNPFIDHPELVELIWGTPETPINYLSTTE